MWINLKDFLLEEISQIQKDKHRVMLRTGTLKSMALPEVESE
jgi:hypothetical protein